MSYPKNDTDFEDGTVTFVVDDGDGRLKVGHHMPNWGSGYSGCVYHPKPGFEVKPGMSIRIYAFMGPVCRGVYIGGRVVQPYLTKEEAREKSRKLAGCMFDAMAPTMDRFVRGSRSVRDVETEV